MERRNLKIQVETVKMEVEQA
jgi:hypothetical protein